MQRVRRCRRTGKEHTMLTLSEIESTQEFEFERRLDAMGEQALRTALANPGELQALAPRHLSREQVLQIATATLEELAARSQPAAAAPATPPQDWLGLLAAFWLPRA
jgi:hypothetical protein